MEFQDQYANEYGHPMYQSEMIALALTVWLVLLFIENVIKRAAFEIDIAK